MKKLLLILCMTSCTQKYNLKRSIWCLEKLQIHMEQDYNAGKIPYERANEYFLTIETIKNDLNKINIKKNDKQKD